jgi:glycosyltransferase involved in cell wall biosynthesis
MKTIAIITSNFPPTNIVGALRPYRLSKFLCKAGWRVIILTHPPDTGHDLDYSLLDEIASDVQIHYVSTPRVKKIWNRGLVARFIGTGRDILDGWVKPDLEIAHVNSFYRAFIKLAKVSQIDVLLTTSPPHSIHLAGLLIKRKFDIPWIVDLRDPWDYYPTKGHHELTFLEGYLEKRVMTEASAVISTTGTYSKILMEKHSFIDKNKFHIVTNSYDRNKTSLAVEKDPDHFIVCYTGIFYPGKDPYGFFRALKSWFEVMPSSDRSYYMTVLRVHLIGSGDYITRQVISSLGLDGVIVYFDRMPHEQAIAMTLAADMVLISTGFGDRTRPGWLPSKLFEYLGCRIPILALTREGETAEVIRRTKSGYVLLSEDHDSIHKILRTEISRKFKCDSQSDNTNFTFEGTDKYEEENVMSGFADIIGNVISRPPRIRT